MPLRTWLKKTLGKLRRKPADKKSEVRHGTGGEIAGEMVRQARGQLAESTKLWDAKAPEDKAKVASTVHNTLKLNPLLSFSFNQFLSDCANFSFMVLSDKEAPLEAKVIAAKILKFICSKPGSKEVRLRVVPNINPEGLKKKMISVWLAGQPEEVIKILDIK